MSRKKKTTAAPEPSSVPLPFSILIDTMEQLPYEFRGIESNANTNHRPYDVQTERRFLQYLGDYSIDYLNDEDREKFGPMPRVIVERKSKSDFFSSMAKRDNFEERIARLCEETEYAAVVVESEWEEMYTQPPTYTKKGVEYESEMSATVIHRTVQSWTIEYQKVHWFFYPGREAAESATFQLLFRFWEKLKKGQTDRQRKSDNYRVYHEGQRAQHAGTSIEECPYPRARTVGDPADWWNRGWLDMADIKSVRTRGRTRCSEPPAFPDHIFSSDFKHEKAS